MPADGLATEPTSAIFDPVAARAEHMVPPEERVLSNKEEWLREKALRPDFRISENELARAANPSRREKAARAKQASADVAKGREPLVRPGERIEPVTTLFNVWTHEALPILPGQSEKLKVRFHMFLRDHFTNQATQMDTRLIGVLTHVADKFQASRIDVVSGYRSPKYNLMLRKKGHEVARDSQHTYGHAVDFRLPGVTTERLRDWARRLRLGGVGYYQGDGFVHVDVGPIRYWVE